MLNNKCDCHILESDFIWLIAELIVHVTLII